PEFRDTDARLAYLRWLGAMSTRLRQRKTEWLERKEFLQTVWYETKRAALDPGLVPNFCASSRPTSARSDSRGNPHASPSSLGTASGVRAPLPNRPAVCHLNSSRYCFLSYISHLAGTNLPGYFDQRIDAAFLH
ncbi:MAG: peptidoglycan lytic transglycosylase, Glycoside Hydrolase Family 23-like protein, partial [Candidatus Acidoferrum typicum]|nr:peptidoglycan lytic transglycosylase, Glycoside Hydrolase Family 23-like protein [Candidatus Acidoferrum typicum]